MSLSNLIGIAVYARIFLHGPGPQVSLEYRISQALKHQKKTELLNNEYEYE